MLRIITFILCIFAFNAYAASPFPSCSAAGDYLQSTTSTNPPLPICATSYPLTSTTGILPIINGGTPYNVIVTNIGASGYIARALTSSSVSNGATTIPLTNTTGFYPNQYVVIGLGGTSGNKNYCALISSVSAGTSITISTTAVTGANLNNCGPYGTATSSTSLTTTVVANTPVYSLGSTTTSSSYSSGATSIAVGNATSYSAGQGIFIAGGATGGANLVSSISSVTSNTIVISPGISNASGISSGTLVMHDDTAAFQAAVNLANYNQNINIFVPDGYYQINGLPTGTANASVTLPSLDYWPGGTGAGGYWMPMATIKLAGNVMAPQMQDYLNPAKNAHISGAVIQSNIQTTGNMFSAYDTNGLRNFTNIQWEVANITFRTSPSPIYVPLNAYYVTSVKFHDLNVDTGETGYTTQPGNSSYDNFAIIGPAGENGGNNIMSNLEVYGYYWGIMASEHTRLEHIRFDNDFYPIMLGSGVSQYGVTMLDTEFDGCPHGIALNNNSYQIPLDAEDMNIEHQSTPSWTTNVDDVSDGNNLLEGIISIDTLSSPIVISGGTNLHVVNYTSPSYPLATEVFSSLSNGHYATAPNGTHIYCSNCTATPTCAGSGNGALATMINGVWSCNGGVGSSNTQVNSAFMRTLQMGSFNIPDQESYTGQIVRTNKGRYGGTPTQILFGPIQFQSTATVAGNFTTDGTINTFSPTASVSAATVRFSVLDALDTTLTASTEAPDVYFNLNSRNPRQHSTGTLALQRDFRITGSTHSFVGASALTQAATLSIDGPPQGGTNATIATGYGLYMPTEAVTNTTNAYTAFFQAPTGGTSTNYSLGSSGNVILTGLAAASSSENDYMCLDSTGNVYSDTVPCLALAGTGLTASGAVLNSNAVNNINFTTGVLSAISNNPFGFTKISKASTVDNLVASSLSLTCTTNPTIALLECGTSTTCASPTTIGSVQITAAGTATVATVSSASITAGDYIAAEITAGACTVSDAVITAQIHSN